MTTLEDLITRYSNTVKGTRERAEHFSKRIHLVGSLRLFVVIATFAGLYHTWNSPLYLPLLIAGGGIVIFALLMLIHSRLYDFRLYMETWNKMAVDELNALDYDFSAFNDGSAYIDPTHLYTYDLDIFGKQSLFQCINRTCTPVGRELLAKWLKNHFTDKEEIEKR
ncbi:MAG: hypothetical protein LBM62_00375, partial [Mediterranea sp.]|nr:hypothetical protein [Mediterranea sp.]